MSVDIRRILKLLDQGVLQRDQFLMAAERFFAELEDELKAAIRTTQLDLDPTPTAEALT